MRSLVPPKPCPFCGEGVLEAKHAKEDYYFLGKCYQLPRLYSTCSVCKSQHTSAPQSRVNLLAKEDFHQSFDTLSCAYPWLDISQLHRIVEAEGHGSYISDHNEKTKTIILNDRSGCKVEVRPFSRSSKGSLSTFIRKVIKR